MPKYLAKAAKQRVQDMLDVNGGAPAQGDVLRGDVNGGYENAGFKTYTITGDGDTIPVATTDYVIHAMGSLTDSTETWTVSLGNGSYAGQQLTLILTADIESTNYTTFKLTIALSGVDRTVSAAIAYSTASNTAAFDLFWDGSAWQVDKPGLNRSNATVTGEDANAIGDGGTASGVDSFHQGSGGTASGFQAIHTGSSGTASGARSFHQGKEADAYLNQQHAQANGNISTSGDAQRTVDVRFLTGLSESTGRSVPTDKALNVYVEVIVAEPGLTNVGSFSRRVTIKNDGGTVSFVGSVDTIGTDQTYDAGNGTIGITLSATDIPAGLQIEMNNATNDTRLVATFYATEVGHP